MSTKKQACRQCRQLSDGVFLVKNYKLTVRLNGKLGELFLKSYEQVKKKSSSVNKLTTSDYARNLLALGLASNYQVIEKNDSVNNIETNIGLEDNEPTTLENFDSKYQKVKNQLLTMLNDKEFNNL